MQNEYIIFNINLGKKKFITLNKILKPTFLNIRIFSYRNFNNFVNFMLLIKNSIEISIMI